MKPVHRTKKATPQAESGSKRKPAFVTSAADPLNNHLTGEIYP